LLLFVEEEADFWLWLKNTFGKPAVCLFHNNLRMAHMVVGTEEAKARMTRNFDILFERVLLDPHPNMSYNDAPIQFYCRVILYCPG